LEQSLRFYRALGATERLRFPERGERADHTVAFLDLGGQTFVELFSPTPGGPQADGAPVPNGRALFHFAIRVDDVDATYARALQSGGSAVEAPTDTVLEGEPPTPCRYAFVAGPSGEMVELIAIADL
jgi:catechol 2,3-dioxygenase-like lactoylglutathione lyase family enzyme